MPNKRKLWQKFVAGFAVGAVAVSAFTAFEGTAVAETASGGASVHKDNVFWWTAPGSGTDEFASDLLAAGRPHTSTSTSKIGDSTLEVTCTISNLGVDGGGNIVAPGLVTKVPGNNANQGTAQDKAGWKGESHGLLYNSGDSPNLLANGLTFFHKETGNPVASGMYNRLVASHVKAEVGSDDKPWTEQVERFGGVVDENGNITTHPATWPAETEFDISCTATLDGQSIPLDGLVVANAESNGNQAPTLEETEYQVFAPRGEGADTATWHVLDIWDSCKPYSYRASDVYDVDANNVLTNHPILGPKTVNGNRENDVMPECPNADNKSFSSSALLKGVTGMHVKIHEASGAAGSIAVGVYLSSDFGDAPQSYGAAGNYWSGTWDNALAKGTSTVLKDMEGKTYQGGVYYTGSSTSPNYFLGTKRDTESPASITFGTDADGDDNTIDGDEDAFPSGRDISEDVKSEGGKVKYSYEAQCTANDGTGYVGGWIDWNLDSKFDTQGEQATATCEGGKATLNWEVDSSKVEPWLARTAAVTPGEHAAPFNDHSFMRLRISSNQDDIKPNGIGNGEGEVEDHTITWDSPVDIEKTVTPENAEPGDKVTWTVTVKNTSNIDYTTAFPMQFTDDLTDVLKVVENVTVQDADGGNASVDDNTLTWTGPVPAQDEVKIVYIGIVKNYADGDAINTVTSAYDGKTDTAEVKLPLLTVAKEASPSPVKKGEKVHFKVTIVNEGKGTAENGKVIDNLAGVNDDGALDGEPTASSGNVTVNGNEMTWTGTLAAGESATVEYDVIANGNADKWLKNTASVDPSQKFNDTADRQKDANTETEILLPPTPEDRETWGKKDEPQSTSLEDMFTPGSSKELTYILEGADENGKVTIPRQGTYEIKDGKVVFTPEPGYVGDPTPVTVKGTDSNGFGVTGTYTPHIKDNAATKTVKRTVTFTYLTEDGTKVAEDVVQEVTFVTEVDVDPETGELGNPDWSKVADKEFPEVQAPPRDGWTSEKTTVPAESVKATDDDWTRNVVYQPNPPVGTPDETYGGKDLPQAGTPSFEVTTPTTPDGSPNEIVKVELLDENGNPATEVTVPEGKYTLNDDGTITFTPNKGFVGDPTPVSVRGTDKNGRSAETMYTPHVVDNTATKTVRRTINYTYLTEEGETVTESVTQEITFTVSRDVDPKTGDVSEPDWSKADSQTVDEVDSPDLTDKGWKTNRPNVPAVEIKATDEDIVENVVYTTTWVTYVDEDGNTIYLEKTDLDEDGNEPKAPKDPTKDGFKFTGWDRSVDELGNVTYTAHWEPVEDSEPEPEPSDTPDPEPSDDPTTPEPVKTTWVTYVDEDGNTIYLEKTDLDKDGNEPKAPKDPTKDGFKFTGWDRSVDELGNVTYTAHWEPVEGPSEEPTSVPWVTYVDEDGNTVYVPQIDFENGKEPAAPADPTKDGYKFTGWTRTVDDLGNVTYTAHWEPVGGPGGDPTPPVPTPSGNPTEDTPVVTRSPLAQTGIASGIGIALAIALGSAGILLRAHRKES